MYRVRSTDVWYNAPGVVAAYQPVAAPDSLAARQNVSNDARMAGRYMAVPGVLPTHNPQVGWMFNGSTQYLTTGIVPASGYSMLVKFSDMGTDNGWLVGAYNGSGNNRFSIGNPNGSSQIEYGSGKTVNVVYGATVASGVLGVAGQQGYRDGSASGAAIGAWTGAVTEALAINGLAGFQTATLAVKIQAVVISAIAFTPAHVAQYSRQMAYTHVNHDWSAWGRRRRYYYAPSSILAAMRRRMPGEVRVGSRGIIE